MQRTKLVAHFAAQDVLYYKKASVGELHMDRAGYKALPLSNDELRAIFEAVGAVGGRHTTQLRLPDRDRTTVSRAYNVALEFERRGITNLDDSTAQVIAEAAKYSTTVSYVQDMFMLWQQWKGWQRRKSEEASGGQPWLVIEFDPQRSEDLGLKTLEGQPWQAACLRCKNTGDATAKGCQAVLVLASGATATGSQGPFYLNPVDEPYTLQRDSATSVDIAPGRHRSWDLVLAPVGQDQGDIAITSGPVYAIIVPDDVRGRPPQEMDWEEGGACIATPIAMTRRGVPQAHLFPGEYLARLEIHDQSGRMTGAVFRIRAPHRGQKIEVELMKRETASASSARKTLTG